jgi:DNA repair protein RecO (recombination protein O)
MDSLKTRGIVLKRTDYGEADRIVTVLTSDQGKLRLMARGVRKPKAKLAGGIELFSVSDMSFIRGRGEIGTLISARLDEHYGDIEDEPEPEYFVLMEQALAALDDPGVGLDLIRAWFNANMLKLSGHAPNLEATAAGHKLTAGSRYVFDLDDMAFDPRPRGRFAPDDIKFLRLLFNGHTPHAISRIGSSQELTAKVAPLVQTMLQTHIRL